MVKLFLSCFCLKFNNVVTHLRIAVYIVIQIQFCCIIELLYILSSRHWYTNDFLFLLSFRKYLFRSYFLNICSLSPHKSSSRTSLHLIFFNKINSFYIYVTVVYQWHHIPFVVLLIVVKLIKYYQEKGFHEEEKIKCINFLNCMI